MILNKMADVWADLESFRKARAIWKATWSRPGVHQTPEEKAALQAMDHRRTGLVGSGDLVEVIDVGDDYAAIRVLEGSGKEGRFGGTCYGYIEPWWDEP